MFRLISYVKGNRGWKTSVVPSMIWVRPVVQQTYIERFQMFVHWKYIAFVWSTWNERPVKVVQSVVCPLPSTHTLSVILLIIRDKSADCLLLQAEHVACLRRIFLISPFTQRQAFELEVTWCIFTAMTSHPIDTTDSRHKLANTNEQSLFEQQLPLCFYAMTMMVIIICMVGSPSLNG